MTRSFPFASTTATGDAGAVADRRDGGKNPPQPRAPRASRRPRNALPHFEAHSVLLFALLAGAGLFGPPRLAQAQAATPAPRSAPASAGAGASPARGTIEAAFIRADSNRDGKLSREEAARFSALAAQFDAMDSDKDQQLSPAEFELGVTQ